MFKELTRCANFHKTVGSTLALCVLFGIMRAKAEPSWRRVAPGLEYRQGWVNAKPEQLLHLIRFDPRRLQVRVLQAKGAVKQTAQEFLQQSKAVAVFNGGYFDPENQPLGLLFADGHWTQAQAATGPAFGGMLTLIDDKPGLHQIFELSEERYQSLRKASQLQFLIQCGPRLLAAGKSVTGLEKTITRRTAIAFDDQGRIIVLTTSLAYGMSFVQLQDYLKNQLKVKWALNLDGGSSTQCSVKGGINNPGYSAVPYVLGLFVR